MIRQAVFYNFPQAVVISYKMTSKSLADRLFCKISTIVSRTPDISTLTMEAPLISPNSSSTLSISRPRASTRCSTPTTRWSSPATPPTSRATWTVSRAPPISSCRASNRETHCKSWPTGPRVPLRETHCRPHSRTQWCSTSIDSGPHHHKEGEWSSVRKMMVWKHFWRDSRSFSVKRRKKCRNRGDSRRLKRSKSIWR